MGIARGTNIVRDGLIYGYDTGYGVADKNTSTRFYPGRPTTNEINFATEDLNNWTSYSNGNDGTFTTEFGTVGLKINNRTSWNGAYKGFTLPSTGTYTFSGWFRYRGGTSNNNGAAVYISSYGGSDTSTWLNKSKIGEWQRVSKTVNVTDVTVTFYFISYGGTQSGGSPDKSSWDVTMPQIEKLSDETPFVNGSRSSTGSLIDLKRTVNVDVSNVSFDSEGQPDYDGTDDKIDLGNDDWIRLGTGFTIEFVVRPEEDKWMYFFHKGYGSNNSLAWGRHSSGDDWFFSTMIGGSYQNSYMGTATLNKYCHLVATYDGANLRLYENGVLKVTSAKTHDMLTSSASAGIGGPDRYWNGKIPVTKIYSKVLTTEEVVSNFKAYKNRFNI